MSSTTLCEQQRHHWLPILSLVMLHYHGHSGLMYGSTECNYICWLAIYETQGLSQRLSRESFGHPAMFFGSIQRVHPEITTVQIAKEGTPFQEILSAFSSFLNMFLFLFNYVILKNHFQTENFEKQWVSPPYHIYKSFKNGKVSRNILQIISSSSCSCLCIWGQYSVYWEWV